MLLILIGLVFLIFMNIFLAKLFDREKTSKKLSSLKSCAVSFLLILLLVNKNLNTEMIFAYLIVEFIFYFINYYMLQNTNNIINKKKLLLVMALIFFSIIFTGIQLSISIPHYNDIIETSFLNNIENNDGYGRLNKYISGTREYFLENNIQAKIIIPIIIYALITTLLLDIIIYIKFSKRIDKKSNNQIINDKTTDWQDFLEKNFKATGTRTNMNDLRLKK